MKTETDTDQVSVPVTSNPITPQEMRELRQAVNPLADCDNLGIPLFVMAHAFLMNATR